MGGASTAAPLDASGALYWNPATISGLPGSSIDFGAELLYPQTRLSSTYGANAFGPGVPPATLSGSDRGDDGVFAIPSMALVYKPEGSDFTYGFGVFTVGGFGTNYRADNTNPILSPALAPVGLGLGSLYTSFECLEMTPTVSWQVTDRLSIGGGPTLALAQLEADPLFLANPNPNGTFPAGTHTRMSWGGGFQIGAFYKLDGGWSVGVSYKSTQWLEGFHFQTQDNLGNPRDISYTFNMPSIASLGVGYTGIERWTFAADFRYIDYGHTQGFDRTGFTSTGSIAGLGWNSVFAVAIGAQYQLSDAVSVRAGYSYNQDPISSAVSSFNVASPTILEHAVYLGFSYQVSDALSLSAAYLHGFENSVDGPFNAPVVGPIAGTSIRSTVSADALVIGATVHFGCTNNSRAWRICRSPSAKREFAQPLAWRSGSHGLGGYCKYLRASLLWPGGIVIHFHSPVCSSRAR